MADFYGLSGAIQGAGNMIINAANTAASFKSDDRNWKAFNKNFDWNKKVYNENVERMNLGLQREDTAVQRRMADLEAAGLHPALAVGSAADSSTSQVSSGSASSPNMRPPRADKLSFVQDMLGVSQGKAQLKMLESQKELVDAQARKTNIEADEYGANVASRRGLEGARTDLVKAQKDREDFYRREMMPNLAEGQRQQVSKLMSEIDIMEHNLALSREGRVRTNDTNQLALIVQFLSRIFEGAARRVGNPFRRGDSEPPVVGGTEPDVHSTAVQRSVYDNYVQVTRSIGNEPMSWDEWLHMIDLGL